MDAFTPRCWEDFIGQRPCIDPLDLAIRAAIERANAGEEQWWRNLAGVVCVGPPGTGKSTLAPLVAARLGLNWCRVQSGQLRTPDVARDWVRRFSQDPSDYLFLVEEAHLCGPGVLEEGFYHPLTHFEFIDDDGTTLPLHALVVWFTSNFASQLPEALLSRCLLLEFSHYSDDEIREILTLSAGRARFTLTDDACAWLAAAAGGEPRAANRILGAAMDGMVAGRRGTSIELGDAQETLATLRMRDGLTEVQFALLAHLASARKGRLGLRALAGMLTRSEKDIATRIEPALLRRGLLAIAGTGRELTPAGARTVARLRANRSQLDRPPDPATAQVKP